MAEFCKDCSIRVLGKDMKDFAELGDECEMTFVLCEGCGFIYVDYDGKKVEEPNQ